MPFITTNQCPPTLCCAAWGQIPLAGGFYSDSGVHNVDLSLDTGFPSLIDRDSNDVTMTPNLTTALLHRVGGSHFNSADSLYSCVRVQLPYSHP